MTRIPDEAVEAAEAAAVDAMVKNGPGGSVSHSEIVLAVLEAALPYLAPPNDKDRAAA